MTTPTITPLPDLTGWPEWEQALSHRARLRLDLADAQREQDRLERSQQAADDLDAQERGRAVREDGKDPGAKHGPKNERLLKQTREAVAMLSAAVAQQDQALRDLLRSDREQAQRAAQTTLEQARSRYQAAVAELVAARAEFHLANQTRHWAATPGSRWKPSQPPPLYVPGAVQANGEPVPTSLVMAALEAESEGRIMRSGQTVNTPGVRQVALDLTPNVKVSVPGAVPGDEPTFFMVPPDQVDAAKAAAAQAERERISLERDRRENLAALQAHAQQTGHPDPLADLREPAPAEG